MLLPDTYKELIITNLARIIHKIFRVIFLVVFLTSQQISLSKLSLTIHDILNKLNQTFYGVIKFNPL